MNRAKKHETLPVEYTDQNDDPDSDEDTLTPELTISAKNSNSFSPNDPETADLIDLHSPPTLSDARVADTSNTVNTCTQDEKDLLILKLSKQLEVANEAKMKQEKIY